MLKLSEIKKEIKKLGGDKESRIHIVYGVQDGEYDICINIRVNGDIDFISAGDELTEAEAIKHSKRIATQLANSDYNASYEGEEDRGGM